MAEQQDSIQELMLSAIELFHYSYKFRDQTVVIALTEVADLLPMLSDLRVLQSSHIQAAIFVGAGVDSHPQIERCNVKGQAFQVTSHSNTPTNLQFAEDSWTAQGLPVFTLGEDLPTEALCGAALDFCQKADAIKFFLVQQSDGILINDVFLSHPAIPELLEELNSPSKCSMEPDLIRFLCNQQQLTGLDIAVLKNIAGSLFQELFTHRGSGSLLTGSYPNLIRTATLKDVTELSLLLTPFIQAGSIVPISEDQIIEAINQYHVFTVNGEIVAAASMREFGTACELGKFCTLPRYQRKGRARLLALSLIDRAKDLKKEFVFALSREPGMWNFFLGLGFEQCTYEDLPEQWLEQYDQSRGSHAFRLEL